MAPAFDRLADVSGAGAAAAANARALVADVAARARSPLEAALHVKRALARHGFRDDPMTFRLDEMLERRGGNCLGLTLFVGAALLEGGHDVSFVIRRNPFDDVHTAGEEHFARLTDPEQGVDEDSRLPDAGDCTARFRFVPVEHASLALRSESGKERPFEATTVRDPDVESAWAPEAESVERVSFHELTSTVRIERAKIALRSLPFRATGDLVERRALRRAARLVLRAQREWPCNREGWADLWRVARSMPGGLAAIAAARYEAIGGADSLYELTRYRMTGDARHLDRALERFPSYAEAYFEKHVVAANDRRSLAIVAWMIAESEILDLERFYREHAAKVAELFSQRELEELLASFA